MWFKAPYLGHLTHWGRVTHICVGKLNIIASDNGLSPGRRQAIIWTNAGILLIEPLGTKFNEFFYRNSYIFIHENALENVVCEAASLLSRPQCVNVRFTNTDDARAVQPWPCDPKTFSVASKLRRGIPRCKIDRRFCDNTDETSVQYYSERASLHTEVASMSRDQTFSWYLK